MSYGIALANGYAVGTFIASAFGVELSRYKEIVNLTDRQKKLQEKVKELAHGMGIQKNIRIVTGENDIQASGVAFFSWSRAAINIPEKFGERDESADVFILKHELSHIKNSDQLIIGTTVTIVTVVASFFCHFAVVVVASGISLIAAMRWREAQADLCDLHLLRPEEIQGGIAFFNQERAKDHIVTKKLMDNPDFESLPRYHWAKLLVNCIVDNDGCLPTLLHPTNISRINKLEEACHRLYKTEKNHVG